MAKTTESGREVVERKEEISSEEVIMLQRATRNAAETRMTAETRDAKTVRKEDGGEKVKKERTGKGKGIGAGTEKIVSSEEAKRKENELKKNKVC